jgi:glycosyltransferase involved in cell wall biosynthesis
MRLSAAIITLDEEANVGRCLDSVAGVADEVVVLDSGSRDGTERICRERGAIFLLQPWLGYGPQKNAAAERTSHEWVLSLDADEALSPELRASLLEVKEAPAADAYAVNRLNAYYGRFVRHGGFYPDRKIRLWRKGAARWSDATIHETAVLAPGARAARLEGDLLHYTCPTREHHLANIERFTTLSAEALHRRGERGTWKRFTSPAAAFVRSYLLRGGFLDGRVGFEVCRLSAYAAWLKYEKVRRLAQGRR